MYNILYIICLSSLYRYTGPLRGGHDANVAHWPFKRAAMMPTWLPDVQQQQQGRTLVLEDDGGAVLDDLVVLALQQFALAEVEQQRRDHVVQLHPHLVPGVLLEVRGHTVRRSSFKEGVVIKPDLCFLQPSSVDSWGRRCRCSTSPWRLWSGPFWRARCPPRGCRARASASPRPSSPKHRAGTSLEPGPGEGAELWGVCVYHFKCLLDRPRVQRTISVRRVPPHVDRWTSRTLSQMSMTELKSRNKHEKFRKCNVLRASVGLYFERLSLKKHINYFKLAVNEHVNITHLHDFSKTFMI